MARSLIYLIVASFCAPLALASHVCAQSDSTQAHSTQARSAQPDCSQANCADDGWGLDHVDFFAIDGKPVPDTFRYLHQLSSGENGNTVYSFQGTARAYYLNDQRIEFTGQEETFGVEAALRGSIERCVNSWQVGLHSEFFLTQRFDENILVDTAERRSFRGLFDDDVLSISQLYFSASRGDWTFAAGKRDTPFGRAFFPLNTNERIDAPFIRTESILWRETGLFIDYRPGRFHFSLAGVNGSEDRDTNSSKGIIGRVGVDMDWLVFGASAKFQDGIGSESQKFRNNHVGLDAMVRGERWLLSGEIIYDEYGFRRPFNPLDITWGRSIYNRDIFFPGRRLYGLGFYLNFIYRAPLGTWVLNYGEYRPQVDTGDFIHDQVTRRGLIKHIYHIAPGIDWYNTLIIENDVEPAQAARIRRGLTGLTGIEWRF